MKATRFLSLLDAEHEDILKYAFASQHNYSMQILSANKKWWEELDPQVRSIIREAAAEALKYQRKSWPRSRKRGGCQAVYG